MWFTPHRSLVATVALQSEFMLSQGSKGFLGPGHVLVGATGPRLLTPVRLCMFGLCLHTEGFQVCTEAFFSPAQTPRQTQLSCVSLCWREEESRPTSRGGGDPVGVPASQRGLSPPAVLQAPRRNQPVNTFSLVQTRKRKNIYKNVKIAISRKT